MKDFSLYHRKKAAEKDDLVAFKKCYEMAQKMQKELEEAEKGIKKKYEPIFKNFDIIAKKRNDIETIYHDCSTFYANDITTVLCMLIGYIEGERYISYRHFENYATPSMVVIKETVDNLYERKDHIISDTLYKNGDLIFINTGFHNTLSFYNYVGEPNYKFGKYNYLYEFVNRLIQYRYDNDLINLIDISMDDLYIFMCDFISKHPDLIMKNKDKRDKMLNDLDDYDLKTLDAELIQPKVRKLIKEKK